MEEMHRQGVGSDVEFLALLAPPRVHRPGSSPTPPHSFYILLVCSYD